MTFHCRANPGAGHTGPSVTNYSEFGLIVASVVLPQWLMPLAITVALSFIISAQINRVAPPRCTSGWRRD